MWVDIGNLHSTFIDVKIWAIEEVVGHISLEITTMEEDLGIILTWKNHKAFTRTNGAQKLFLQLGGGLE